MKYTISNKCNGCTACTTVCPTKAITGTRGKMHTISAALCVMCGACGKQCMQEAVLDTFGLPLEKLKRSQWPKPEFMLDECYSCENCAHVCPSGSIVMEDIAKGAPNPRNREISYPRLANAKTCVGCGVCAEYCGFGAIAMKSPEASASAARTEKDAAAS